MDYIHAMVDCAKLERNLLPSDTGGLNNGIPEAVNSLSTDEVKVEDNFIVEELSLTECRNVEKDIKTFQEELIERSDSILPYSSKPENVHSLSVRKVKLEDNSSEEESFFVEYNDDEDSKSFQIQVIEGEKIGKREDFNIPENLKLENVQYLFVDEVKLEDDFSKEEASLSEFRNNDEDSNSFEKQVTEWGQIWKKEDFNLRESCVLRFDEEQRNEITFPKYSKAIEETNLDNCHRSEYSAMDGINLNCQIGNVSPKNFMGGNSGIECNIDYIHRKGENHECNLETGQKRKSESHIDDECTTTVNIPLEYYTYSARLKLKQHKCQICEFTTAQKEKLQSHIDSVHLKLKNHKCHSCDYTTARKNCLKSHINNVHLMKLKHYKCHMCDYTSSQKRSLRVHIDGVHLKLKKHKCHLCEYSSAYKGDLETHINGVHLKLKHHKCQMCEYSTSQKQGLQAHFDSVHLKLKKHQCHMCEFAASQKGGLKAHINSVHLKLKNYKCPICKFKTTEKSRLKAHTKFVHLKLEKHK